MYLFRPTRVRLLTRNEQQVLRRFLYFAAKDFGLPAGLAVAVSVAFVVFVGTGLLVAFTAPGTWKAR